MESAAQSLLGNVGQLLGEEYQLLSSVGGEVTELRDDLATMNALLRMQAEADDGAVDHFVREWMKQLRELSYDSEDCVDLYKLRIKSRPGDGALAWLERLLRTLWPRRHLASELRALRARATAIGERHARYGVNRDALRRYPALPAPPVMAAALHRAGGDPDEKQRAVGIEDQADTLAKRVKASVEEEGSPKVFFILGSKGDDRTRLAMEACRRLELKFPFQARVEVSPAFEPGKNLRTLLKHVVDQVDGGAVEEEGGLGDMDSLDVDRLAKKLAKSLKDKRYLILINDVRTTTAWDAIRSKLPQNNQNGRIMVTTPTETVTKEGSHASVSGHYYIYSMKPVMLQDDDHRHQFVGVKDQVDSLGEKIKKKVKGSGLLCVFSIVGFGGVGKTTLAMELCRQLEADFPFQAMESVSQVFESSRDLRPLLKRLLEQLVKCRTENANGVKEERAINNINSLDDKQLAAKLKEALNDKRCLIVIDDVWTIRAWEEIQSALLPPKNKYGSRIIVTTRIDSVAKACSPAGVSGNYIHHMKALKLEDSKKLFLSKAFGSVDAEYPKELKDVMGNILKKCGGLPLAIVSIANVLAGYKSSGSKEKWETICKSIGSQMESNPTLEGMRHIVTLSYNHLPYELKNCMMYLSIFPEDYEINKDRLLARWIAEGLVLEKRGLTLVEVAESYLEELVSRNMVEPRFGFDGKVESCRMHDVLLEVMVSRSLECNFASLLGGQYAGMSYDRVRRLSIHGDDDKISTTKQPKKKKVRYGVEGMDVEHIRSLSVFRLAGNLLANLDKFKLLRVLDLEDCEGLADDHMRSICRLRLLKFLSLKDTGIEKLPREVGKLEHLQVFDIRGSKLGHDGVPETVTNLEKLERLEFKSKRDWSIFWTLPKGVSKMKALRVVAFAFLRNDIDIAEEIGELEQLQELTLYFECDKEVLDKLAESLGKISLRSLNIGSTGWSDLQFLHDLPKPPRLLRYLRMTGGIGQKLPQWISSLTYLAEIVISWVFLDGDEPFSILCKLPSLKSIGMERKYYTGDKLVARTKHKFSALVNLMMTCHSDGDVTPRVYRFEAGAMPKLETLLLDFSHYDKSVEGIKHLMNLRVVQLVGNKDNNAMAVAIKQLKDERKRRPESNRFQVVVKR